MILFYTITLTIYYPILKPYACLSTYLLLDFTARSYIF